MQIIPPDKALADTRRWLDKAVIGLNLCPFAKAVRVRGQIRFRCSDATDTDALLRDFVDELNVLHRGDPDLIDTTLLVHPYVLHDFDDYNAFLDVAETAISALGFDGVFQLASFHPAYRFAGTGEDDITNCSNRSPHPILHLLREDSVTRAVEAIPDADDIVESNMRRLRALGAAGWEALGLQDD
ncbi:MAG: DUF1415 domain-containing protein [Burkholderiaceae bacterium]